MGNIVWVASYPKSGNTWMRVLLYNFIKQTTQPASINRLGEVCDNESNRRFYEHYFEQGHDDSPESVAKLRTQVHSDIAANAASSVMLKTHNFLGNFEGHQLHNMNKTSAVIYIVRNPLDVVISVAKHYSLSIDEAIEFMSKSETCIETADDNVYSFLGSWSEHVSSWTNNAPKHQQYCVIRYEDLMKDTVKSFKKVASLLGIKDIKGIKSAVKFSSFQELKKQEKTSGFNERATVTQQFFRKGHANQWREVLSDEQVDKIISAHREQMKLFNYLPKGR